jgi:hypothetical protein
MPALGLLCLFGAGVQAQQQFNVIATIVDPATNQPPDKLTAEDVRVTEDGVQLKVTKIDTVDRVVKAQLLIDNGVGIGSNLSQLRSALRGLVELLPPDVETTIVTTAPQPRILVRPTKNREDLLKGVDRLTPDSATGRFTEGITEAAERANKEKDAFTVIIAAGTTSGDSTVQDGDLKRLVASIANRPIVVHVLLYGGEKAAFGGDVQIEVGQRAAKMTGGRYEYINSMNRYVTLLPEFGADVAKQLVGSKRQFRITALRADGKSGPMGKMSLSAGARIIPSVRVE